MYFVKYKILQIDTDICAHFTISLTDNDNCYVYNVQLAYGD